MPLRKRPPKDEPLRAYRAKRSADRTPEPFGGKGRAAAATSVEAAAGPDWARPRPFVVQKHSATRLHYDFRLELGGVLRSWAVPKGPSPDPVEKRLAVEVEDHPVEYADFEGVIPGGNYGSGVVIVWDKGLWIPLEDPEEGIQKGKLLFELRGHKLRGLWHLFRTKAKGQEPSKDWLLVKKPDAWSGKDRVLPPESIYSGLTLEEVRDGNARAAEGRSTLVRLGAPRRPVRAAEVKMMLAETREGPFSAPGWFFELKYDGFRVVAGKEADGKPRLVYRKGSDATAIFPEVARALSALPFEGLVLDGEVVILDEEARPSFQRLQKRALLTRAADIQRAAVELPATYYAFDLLGFEDFDLRPLPLSERKGLLRQVLPRAGPVRFVDHIEEQGEAFYKEVGRMRLEGMMAKKADSPYRAGRSPDWLKVRVDRTGDFVVVGFTAPQGARAGFGALHLATYESGRLVYAGRVGTGFNDEQLQTLRAELEQDRRPTPPCTGPLPPDKGTVWVEPRRVVEVRYKEWTGEGLLRQPVFLRFRDDKPIEECVREGKGGTSEPLPPPPSIVSSEPPPERKVPFSNLDKVFWPEEGYTKGDLIEFYRAVSPWLLPYLKDRPLVLTRYPDGVTGKNFFQKDAPGFVPGWVRLERIWSEQAQREIDYFIADDEETLLYIINLGTIPLHVWASRISDIPHPDWCILDLDPKEAPFADVVKVAQAVHELTEEMETPSFVKTSGSTGIHVLVPLGGQCTFEQAKTLGELMARVVAERRPEIATTIRLPASRGGRVYVDFLQNGHGKLLAAPFCARPVAGAKVSTPLAWSEVKAGLDPARFTIRTVPERLRAQKEDPLRGVLSEKPDLARALARLAGLIKG
jgi:bifunctional non-homologous end joining protein LigD